MSINKLDDFVFEIPGFIMVLLVIIKIYNVILAFNLF